MNILIVDDDQDFSETLALNFKDEGHQVFTCANLSELKNHQHDFTHALVDLRLANESGLEAISLIREKNNTCTIIMLTAYASIATSVEAIKKGADNYLMKPCSFEEIRDALLSKNKTSAPPESSEHYNLYDKEREYIEYVLNLHQGNITKAAEALGIRRQSLQRKLKKLPSKKH